MTGSNNRSEGILIVDDDAGFRAYVTSLLTGRGYKVFEARNVQFAEEILASVNPKLIIVDYKLPDMDGVTWIGQLRDRGVMTPIAFVSGYWCDPKTFNWLRNILRVSLVLQKPVAAEIFVEVIESILPDKVSFHSYGSSQSEFNDAPSLLHLEAQNLLKEYPDSSIAKQELEKLLVSQQPEAVAFSKIGFLRRKLEAEEAIRSARVAYLKDLGPEWQTIIEKLKAIKENPFDGIAIQDVLAAGHKIKGTAGSFDLGKVSHGAERLENIVRSLDPRATETEAEIIWAEIFRVLSDTELAIIEAQTLYGTALPEASGRRARILALTDSLGADLLTSYSKYADLSYASSHDAALTGLARVSFDAVLVAEPFASQSDLINFCRDLRLAATNPSMPLLLVTSKAPVFSPAQMSYAGFSAFLPLEPDPADVQIVLEQMIGHAEKARTRVLVVDDDPALTAYVTKVLDLEGFHATSLNEPIYIKEALEKSDPEVVVLDVIMPGLTGYDVCREIRNHPRWREAAVLFLTAKSNQEGRALAFRAGGDDLIGKPVLKEELLARVTAYAERAKLKRAQTDKDQLTKLMSRPNFLEHAATIMQECLEVGVPSTLSLITIKGFEEVQNTTSIEVIEGVLSSLGSMIRGRFEPQILRCRFGERVFGLFMPDVNRQQAASLLYLLNQEFESVDFQDQNGEIFTLSLIYGIGSAPEDGDTIGRLKDLAIVELGQHTIVKGKI